MLWLLECLVPFFWFMGFFFFLSHYYVNVCAFAWILILFLIGHFIMKIFRECIVNVSLFSLSLIAELGVYILSFVGMECT